MAISVAKEDVWVAALADKPGALAEKLAALKDAGADLKFLIARRSDDKKGEAVVFLTPLKGAAVLKVARAMGFRKSKSLHSVRVDAPNKKGLGARITCALAEKGLNLRGVSAAVMGAKCVAYLAFDSAADAGKAIRIIKTL